MIGASLLLTLTIAQAQQTLTPAPHPGAAPAPARTAPALSPDLSAVRDLYASASFEDALARLDTMDASNAQVQQYRALCLLGLGRTAEAQQSLERMVASQPLYTISDTDVSPRLVAMFHTVRRRLLPTQARDLYVRAKRDLDDKKFVVAEGEFKELLAILADDDMAEEATGFLDLKMLGEGFLKLTEGELAAEAKAAPPAPAPASTPAPASSAAAAPKVSPAVYSDIDSDVTAPVEVERRMPAWHPTGVLTRTGQYHGMLEVVINEHGLVESATIKRSISPLYDPSLLQATKDWRFQPATRAGQPVKYRKTFDITLSAR